MGVNMSNCCFPDGPNSARRVPAAGRQVSMQQTPDTDERISQEMKLEREPSCREAPDSAAMVIDLEKLTAPGAQRSVTARPKSSQDQALLREAQITSPGDPLYNVAMKALWHGCPDVLELALSRLDRSLLSEDQQRDANLMAQKLEFVRIGQQFVALCHEFHKGGSAAALRAGAAMVEHRCERLMSSQPERQQSRLPGLITRRDTILLHSKIQSITRNLVGK